MSPAELLSVLDMPMADALPVLMHATLEPYLPAMHVPKPTCWCQPDVAYEDPLTGNRLYTHRAES